MLRSTMLLVSLAVCGSHAAALPVYVALDWPSDMPASALARVRIEAVRTVGLTGSGAPVEAEAGADGVVLHLSDGVWQVQASALGYWSQGAEVVVARQAPTSVHLALWPAASLHGEILTAGGESLPRTLDVRLSAVPAPAEEITTPRTESSLSHTELHCQIDEGTWNCLGPAGMFDVQLEASGYAPRYEWGMSLKAAQSTDLGRTVLRRAASVFGRAVRKDGSNPSGPCHATLRADVERRGAPELDPESAPDGETSFSVPLSQRGYFQVVGVPPGRHVLAVECPAASGVRELRVHADSENRIESPLLVEELTLNIVVTPRVDPEGRPWNLTVDATAPHLRRIADNAPISAEGSWARRGLMAGIYRVALKSSDGTQWLQRFFKLGAGSGPLSLRVRFVDVAGRVTLNTQPLRSRLMLFNEAGGDPATLASDDDGRFHGLLPVTNGDVETHWTVEVHATQPPISRRLEGVRVQSAAGQANAWLELALPIAAVRGTVVSEEGEPQSGAQITFEDTSGARTSTATDDAGSFQMRELSPGSYTVVAESVEGVSERTALDVVEGIESELKLVLNPSERVLFHVVSSQGPVPDTAVQVWIAPGVPRSFTRTDADGRFEANLPPGTTEVGLTVGAPGYALKLIRLPLSSEHTITLDESGGALALDLRGPGHALDSPTTPYLVHKGAIEAAGTLVGWDIANAGISGRGPMVVKAIEPGDYALCFLEPAELTAIWGGKLPSNSCRLGSVQDGETLTLSPPSSTAVWDYN